MKTIKWIKIARYVLLLAIIAWALFRLAPHFKDFSTLWKLKDHISYGWLFLAIFSQLFQYIGDAWVAQVLLKMVNIKVKLKDTFRIAAMNVFAAHMLPIGEAGGMAVAYHFYRKLGVSTEKFIFLTVYWSILAYVLLFFLLLFPLPFIPSLNIKIDTHFIFIGYAFLLIIFSLYIARKAIYSKLKTILDKYNWFQHGASFINKRKLYKKIAIEKPGLVIQATLGMLMNYGSNIGTLILSFMVFGTFPPLLLACFAYSASLLLGRITFAPAGLGAAEASLVLIFIEGKVDSTITIGAVLIYRLISFWLPIPGGFLSFYSLKKNLEKEILTETEMKDL